MKLFTVMQTSFENFDNTVRAFLSKTFNNLGLQYTHSQIFGVIFDGLKGIMENAMFYIEDALTEQNIFTAIRKKSIYSLAKISGYDAYYGSAATGILIGTMNINNGLQSKTTKVYIKNKSRVLDRETGMTYSMILPSEYYVFDISKPLITHEFKIVQGTFSTSQYVSQGLYLETVHIDSSDLFDIQYINVTVDGEEWEQVSCLYDMTEGGKQYIYSTGYDNTFDIMFGNDVYGLKLTEGQIININYLHHGGTLGNITPNSKTDFVFMDYGYDTLGNDVNPNDYMSLSMSTCISGGTNSDSIAFIKNMIGSNSRSLVLANEKNYKLFFKRFSFIGYINCWSEANSMIINTSCLQNIKNKIQNIDDYYNLDTSDLILTDEQKDMVINTLENSNRAFAGVSIQFKDPVIRKFAFITYIKTDNVYNRELAKSNVRSSLAKYFINLDEGVQFIPKSDLIKKIIDESDVIKSCDIDIISEVAEETFYNGYYDKYELKYINGYYQYVTTRYIYEEDNTPCLDSYDNISLDSKLEIPILHGGFKYYPDKTDKNSYINIEDIQVFFI